MTTDLKTSLWVEAHIRTCFSQDMPAFVVSRGDADRGGILLKIDRFSAGFTLLERTLDFDGNRVWRKLAEGTDPADAAERVQKKRQFDEDLWVIEIEDLKGTYTPDAPILET